MFLLPAAFSGHCQASQVMLAWAANADPAVAGYKLYYGYASRTYAAPADVGKPDILWWNVSTCENSIWLMDGIAPVATAFLPTVLDQNWIIIQ
jgi:hypothetical protein